MGKTDLGKWGEIHAVRYLRDRGYDIINANYRTRFGEVDVIASDGKCIIFCEVKSRSNLSKGSPKVYVDQNKQRKIIMSAAMFFKRYKPKGQVRFDVIEVYFGKGDYTQPYSIEHIKSAFDAQSLKLNIDFGG